MLFHTHDRLHSDKPGRHLNTLRSGCTTMPGVDFPVQEVPCVHCREESRTCLPVHRPLFENEGRLKHYYIPSHSARYHESQAMEETNQGQSETELFFRVPQ